MSVKVVTLPQIEEVTNDDPGPKTIGVYSMCKRDSLIVVAQLCPEFTARLVDRWQELEAQVAAPARRIPSVAADAGLDCRDRQSGNSRYYLAAESWHFCRQRIGLFIRDMDQPEVSPEGNSRLRFIDVVGHHVTLPVVPQTLSEALRLALLSTRQRFAAGRSLIKSAYKALT